MASSGIKRMRYSERQYLRTKDFKDEQYYHVVQRRRHSISHHTDGIAYGLDIQSIQTVDGTDLFVVTPGVAVDKFGREIVVSTTSPLEVNKITAQLGNENIEKKLNVWIVYDARPSNLPSSGYQVCESEEATRTQESYRFIYQDNPPFNLGGPDTPPVPYVDLPDDPTAWSPVFLGEITWDGNKITEVDPKERRYIGIVASYIVPPIDQRDERTVTVEAKEMKISGLQEGESARLVLDGNAHIRGGEVVFQKKKPSTEDPNVSIRRRDDNDLLIQLGEDPEAAKARLVIGTQDNGHVHEKVAFTNEGDMTVAQNLAVAGNTKAHRLQAGNLLDGQPFRISAGKTEPEQWQEYKPAPGANIVSAPARAVFVDIKAISAQFTGQKPPIYVATPYASSPLPEKISVTIAKPNDPNIQGFSVNVAGLDMDEAKSMGLYVNWMAIEV